MSSLTTAEYSRCWEIGWSVSMIFTNSQWNRPLVKASKETDAEISVGGSCFALLKFKDSSHLLSHNHFSPHAVMHISKALFYLAKFLRASGVENEGVWYDWCHSINTGSDIQELVLLLLLCTEYCCVLFVKA